MLTGKSYFGLVWLNTGLLLLGLILYIKRTDPIPVFLVLMGLAIVLDAVAMVFDRIIKNPEKAAALFIATGVFLLAIFISSVVVYRDYAGWQGLFMAMGAYSLVLVYRFYKGKRQQNIPDGE